MTQDHPFVLPISVAKDLNQRLVLKLTNWQCEAMCAHIFHYISQFLHFLAKGLSVEHSAHVFCSWVQIKYAYFLFFCFFPKWSCSSIFNPVKIYIYLPREIHFEWSSKTAHLTTSHLGKILLSFKSLKPKISLLCQSLTAPSGSGNEF